MDRLLRKRSLNRLLARNFQTSADVRIRIVWPVPVELDLAEIGIRIPVTVRNLATRKALILVPLSVHITEYLSQNTLRHPRGTLSIV